MASEADDKWRGQLHILSSKIRELAAKERRQPTNREDSLERTTKKLPGDELILIRSQIDSLDAEIAKLLSQRLELAARLSSVKRELGVPTQDEQREQEVLGRVQVVSENPQIAKAILSVYQTIMAQSRELQIARYPNEKRESLFPKVLIVGLGLIGGALARQIRKLDAGCEIVAVDKKEIVDQALKQGVIDNGGTNIDDKVSDASLIILAASPNSNIDLLKQVAKKLSKGQIVIDVTSTKSPICNLADALELHGAEFIGGHPCFGSEKSGFAASCEINPDGRVFALVPTKKSSDLSVRRVSDWLTTLNFKVETTDAATHDQAMACLSHVLQLVISCLVASLAEDDDTGEKLQKILSLSGTGFNQILRLAESPVDLWAEIVFQNKELVLAALEKFKFKVDALIQAISLGDEATIRTEIGQLFAQACSVKQARC